DEELGNWTGSQPCSVGAHDLHHIGGLACDGQLPWPGESRTPPFPRIPVRTAILFHIGIGKLTQNSAREQRLDEEILFEDHLFSCCRAHMLKKGSWLGRPLFPCDWLHNRLHIRDAHHRVSVTVHPVKAKRRT